MRAISQEPEASRGQASPQAFCKPGVPEHRTSCPSASWTADALPPGSSGDMRSGPPTTLRQKKCSVLLKRSFSMSAAAGRVAAGQEV